jgi:hypothetical protein
VDVKTEFIAGLVKPLIDFIASIPLYLIFQLFLTLNAPGNLVLLLGVFTFISFLEEYLWAMMYGYYTNAGAISKSLGILAGTAIFWGLLDAPQKIVGDSQVNIFASSLFVIMAMFLGITLRCALSERRL